MWHTGNTRVQTLHWVVKYLVLGIKVISSEQFIRFVNVSTQIQTISLKMKAESALVLSKLKANYEDQMDKKRKVKIIWQFSFSHSVSDGISIQRLSEIGRLKLLFATICLEFFIQGVN